MIKSNLLLMASSEDKSSQLISKGLVQIRYLFYIQIFSKLFTFILSTIVARKVNASIFGVANLQIQLLLNIILPLSREGFRRSSLRANKSNESKIYGFTFLSIPLGIILSCLFGYLFLNFTSNEESQIVGYNETIILTIIAAIVEILSEPFYIKIQNHLLFQPRAIIEISALFIKCCVVFVLVIFGNYGLIAFGIAQLFYALSLLFGYFIAFYVYKFDFFPKIQSVGRDIIYYWSVFEWQTFQKMILQEGEKLILKAYVKLSDQGTYAIVSVLGALVVKFVFQWLEEGLFPIFSIYIEQMKSLKDIIERRKAFSRSLKILKSILKLLIIIGLTLASFGANYSYLVLHLLYGEKYSSLSTPIELSWYCWYLFIIGINGTTEAYSHSISSAKELSILNIFMVGQSILSVVITIGFIKSGVVGGVIIANCIIILTRILINLWNVKKVMKNLYGEDNTFYEWLRSSIPHIIVIGCFTVSYFITQQSEIYLCNQVTGFNLKRCSIHTSIGGVLFLITLGMLYKYEQNTFKEISSLIKSKIKDTSHKKD